MVAVAIITMEETADADAATTIDAVATTHLLIVMDAALEHSYPEQIQYYKYNFQACNW